MIVSIYHKFLSACEDIKHRSTIQNRNVYDDRLVYKLELLHYNIKYKCQSIIVYIHLHFIELLANGILLHNVFNEYF